MNDKFRVPYTNGGTGDEDCKDCKDTGEYITEIKGMDKAIILADCVEAYIKSRLLKNFEF